VQQAAELSGFPSLGFGGVSIEAGVNSWDDFLFRAEPFLLAAGLHRLGRGYLLTRTAPGRARLRCWLNKKWAGEWGDEPLELAERLRETVKIFGDATMAPPIRAAFAIQPVPVQQTVADESYVLAVGHAVRGWTRGPLGTGDRMPIQVSGTSWGDITRTTLHEVGHCWFGPRDLTDIPSPTVTAYEDALAIARREGWPVAKVEANRQAEETLVRLCVWAWGLAL
jgi:hypothetical protein